MDFFTFSTGCGLCDLYMFYLTHVCCWHYTSICYGDMWSLWPIYITVSLHSRCMQFKTFLGDIPIYLCTLICPCIPTCILIHMVDACVVKCGFLAVVVPKYIHIKCMYIMLYGLYGLYNYISDSYLMLIIDTCLLFILHYVFAYGLGTLGI